MADQITTTEEQDLEAKAWKTLESVVDPEIPVLSLIDLRIIRAVRVSQDEVQVEITPTFMGCPALERMKEDIKSCLRSAGFRNARVTVNLSTAWSTEFLTDETKEKLRQFGIAPPPRVKKSMPATLLLPVACPFCQSKNTQLENAFGSTLCKQIYYCNSCRQSFERFKPL